MPLLSQSLSIRASSQSGLVLELLLSSHTHSFRGFSESGADTEFIELQSILIEPSRDVFP